MSILAEPKRRQKLSVDPRNLTWKNDDQKVSKKLMEKMGWNEGDGLGKHRQGNADNVKLRPNHTGQGLGANDKLAEYDATWIACHDDFADLLNALNRGKDEEPKTDDDVVQRVEKISMELKSKAARRRIHYQKFTRAKDTSNYTESDKTAIFGRCQAAKNASGGPEEEKPTSKESSDSDKDGNSPAKDDGNHTVSTLSVSEYFAAKMAALKAKKSTWAPNEDVDGEQQQDEDNVGDKEEMRRKEEKKERKRLRREQKLKEKETEDECCEAPEDVESEKKRLKKQRKLARLQLLEQPSIDDDESSNQDVEEPKAKKSKTTTSD